LQGSSNSSIIHIFRDPSKAIWQHNITELASMKKRKANPREERTHCTTLLHRSNSSVSHMFRDLQQQYASVPSNVDLKHNIAPQYSSEKTRYLQHLCSKRILTKKTHLYTRWLSTSSSSFFLVLVSPFFIYWCFPLKYYRTG